MGIIFSISINLHVPFYSTVMISIQNKHFLKTVPLFIKYTGTPVVVLYLPSAYGCLKFLAYEVEVEAVVKIGARFILGLSRSITMLNLRLLA